ncbi:MAG: LysR substrate-binding domain-containing protein [Pelagimonas sp.]|jgi:LysR family hydrogen peroxide-inducible transcriptional activator|nr:LysR substrate-binding domain-containing protein [Pelagimonas sp.]
MENISLKQLRYFVALAEAQHFGRAADLCAISQPALSLQIKELETTLAVPLFERGTRSVRLTRLGQVLAKRAEDILNEVRDFADTARASKDDWQGDLRLGLIPTIAPYLLPKIALKLAQHFPQIDLAPIEAKTDKLVTRLQRGQLDLAIMALPVGAPGLTEFPLFEESFLLVRTAKDAGKPVPDVAKLGLMRLLLLEEGHCFRDQALSFCNLPTQTPQDLLEGSSLSTLVQMVSAGIGVTLLPEMARQVETASADVETLRFSDPQPKRQVGAVWRKTAPQGDRYKRILNTLFEDTL